MHDIVSELLVPERAIDKLGARGISIDEAEQLPHNRHTMVRNPSEAGESGSRQLLIGRTDGGRFLTLVVERTIDPTTWLIITGWSSTDGERNLLRRTP
jgi:uncharacterized DUF497 family protein